MPGSLFYMPDNVQRTWQHGLKAMDGAGPRISLTWRAVREGQSSVQMSDQTAWKSQNQAGQGGKVS